MPNPRDVRLETIGERKARKAHNARRVAVHDALMDFATAIIGIVAGPHDDRSAKVQTSVNKAVDAICGPVYTRPKDEE